MKMPRATTPDRPANRKNIAAMHHRSIIRWLCLLILLAIGAGSLYAQSPTATEHTVFVPLILKLGSTSSGGGAIHTGEATYYTEADGGGNCSFDPTPQDLMVGAMN